jgi:hypothetical protein
MCVDAPESTGAWRETNRHIPMVRARNLDPYGRNCCNSDRGAPRGAGCSYSCQPRRLAGRLAHQTVGTACCSRRADKLMSSDSYLLPAETNDAERLAFQLGYALADRDHAEARYREAMQKSRGNLDDAGVKAAWAVASAVRVTYELADQMYKEAQLAKPTIVEDTDGFRLRPDPLTARTAADLVACLRQYRAWAGNPSLRKIAAKSRRSIGASTLCNLLRGDTLPSLESVLAVITGCGGNETDRQRFATAWRRIESGQFTDLPTMSAGPSLRVLHPALQAG